LYEAPTPTDFYAEFLSGAQRLPNGNTLICYGPHGRLFEVDETMAVVWDYINPVVTDGVLCRCESIPGAGSPIQDNASFRVLRYALAYAAFDGRDLTPMGPIEYYYGDYNCDSLVNTSDILEVIAGWGNPYGIYEILSIIKYWGGSGCP
jgi:hypothetical protein